jgi:alkanesulfonate monooxygenase SsuD/methylene tetrahydromethanopterin reductase-like flavin-dependent oxidoreductase (luciferase family)
MADGRTVVGSLRTRIAVGRVLPEAKTAAGAIMHTLSGEPEQIALGIKAYADAGLDHLVAHFGDNSRDSILTDMRRFAEEVRPHL